NAARRPGQRQAERGHLAAGRRGVRRSELGRASCPARRCAAEHSRALGLNQERGRTMINEGDKAPTITATASDGSSVNLASPGQPLVLYFYPKDDTSGCTREAQDFTALAKDFENAGVKVVGISRDPMKAHEKFIGK